MRKTMFAVGAGLAASATVGWMVFAPDALIRYPSDLDQTLTYRGVVARPVSPGDSAETHEDLTVTRHIWVASSTHDTAEIREIITTRIGTETLEHQVGFTIDRRTMKTVRGDGNYSFTPTNTVDRRGAYGPNLPVNLDKSGKYRMWNDDAGVSYNLIGSGTETKAAGLDVVEFTTQMAPHPVTAAYRDFLDLPAATTLREAAELADVDLAVVLAALDSALPDAVMQEVIAATTAPLPLDYYVAWSGRVGIEPTTGGIVDVSNVVNRLSVAPDLDALGLESIVADHAQDPTVRTVLSSLAELAEQPPLPAMSMTYAQTPSSVRAAADTARDLRTSMWRVNVGVPLALAAIALLLLVGALVPRGTKPATIHLHRRHFHRRVPPNVDKAA